MQKYKQYTETEERLMPLNELSTVRQELFVSLVIGDSNFHKPVSITNLIVAMREF
jgi:hypothetical protein